ncbi:MAG TPA: glycosyltransferase family 4 protein [Verrucomicrobiae bacterium]|nr:glycosyltransferase family 4 protein [Verrucomicrobiae bacterium]
MKILMYNWRDLKNPKSGGAEVLTEGIFKKLAKNHDITLFTATFPGALEKEIINGYKVVRKGNFFTVFAWAFIYWHKHFKKQSFDVVIDQIHGIPFFTPLYVRNVKIVAFIHEVARDIWFQMYPFPISIIGKSLEPIFFWFYRKVKFITVSNSTKGDLIAIGIPERNIAITPEAIDDEMFVPVAYPKESDPTLIFIGRMAAMKRPEHVIEAFRLAHEQVPNLKLWMVGGGEESYVKRLQKQAGALPVSFFGKVGIEKKKELLAKAWAMVSSSIKEGFGLVVIEAAAHGTPSIVYNVHGFRDSVKNNETGLITEENTPEGMAKKIVTLMKDRELHNILANNSVSYSQQFTFNHAAQEFIKLVA